LFSRAIENRSGPENSELNRMRIKSYYAHAVEDAMSQARQELGPDAMLVNTRRAPLEARHLGDYEVVFATDVPLSDADTQDTAGGERTIQPSSLPHGDRLARELADLKKELEGMRRTLQHTAFVPGQSAAQLPGYSDAYATLMASDLDPDSVRQILDAAEARQAAGARTSRRDSRSLREALREELESRFAIAPSLGRSEASPRIVALVGPPGAGKTTTLVKLAVNYGLACRRPVLLLSVDNYRIAAGQQLQSYAAILGVGFHILETVGALAQAIEESRGKDLILIDTPGFGFSDLDISTALAGFLATRQDIDTHLVLPASMKSSDLARVADRYAIFQPDRLLFTKLDETGSLGGIYQEAARSGRPLSFFATGQRIPEDLETASKTRLLEALLGAQPSETLSAA
jgi:flagellar biosynthesis protein FlhF